MFIIKYEYSIHSIYIFLNYWVKKINTNNNHVTDNKNINIARL